MIYILGGSPASAGLDTTCQEKILSSLQSFQDQIAELRSSTATSSTAATAPEPPKEKRIAKELSVRYFVLSCMVILHTEPRPFIANIQSAIHSTVKHLRDQTENAMEWNTSLRYMRSSTCITDVLHDEVSQILQTGV